MKRSIILFMMLLLVPAAIAQLSVFHRLSELSADGGATSVDPDGDGRINNTFLQSGWNTSSANLVADVSGNVSIGTSSILSLLTLSTLHNQSAIQIIGEGLSTSDPHTYLFIQDRQGDQDWGLQAQDDGDFGVHLAGQNTFITVKNDTGRVGIGPGGTGIADSPTHELSVQGSVNVTGTYYGDGSGLTNLPSTAGSMSCVTFSTSFSSAAAISCSTGTMTGGGTDCSPGGVTGGRVVANRPNGNGWYGQCISAGFVYVRCCSIV